MAENIGNSGEDVAEASLSRMRKRQSTSMDDVAIEDGGRSSKRPKGIELAGFGKFVKTSKSIHPVDSLKEILSVRSSSSSDLADGRHQDLYTLCNPSTPKLKRIRMFDHCSPPKTPSSCTPKSSKEKFHVFDDPEEQGWISASSLPLDMHIWTKARFLSHNSFDWCQHVHSRMEALCAVPSMMWRTSSIGSGRTTPTALKNRVSSQNVMRFLSSLYYYSYDWRRPIDVEELLSTLECAFHSLHPSVRPFFYVNVGKNSQIVFIARGIGGARRPTLVWNHPPREALEFLRSPRYDHLSFIPLGSSEGDSDSVVGASLPTSTMQHARTSIACTGTIQITYMFQALCDLITADVLFKKVEDIRVLSPTPFLHGRQEMVRVPRVTETTMKRPHTDATEKRHLIELEGVILPHMFQECCVLFRETQSGDVDVDTLIPMNVMPNVNSVFDSHSSVPLSMCSSQMEMSEMTMGDDDECADGNRSMGGSVSCVDASSRHPFMSLLKDPKTSPSIGAHRLESVRSTEEGWKFKLTDVGKTR